MKHSSSRDLMAATIGTSISILPSSKALTKVLRAKGHMDRHKIITSIFRNNWIDCIKGGKILLRVEFSNLINSIQVTSRICIRNSQIKWWFQTFKTCTIAQTWTILLTRTLRKMREWRPQLARTMWSQIIWKWTRMASRIMGQFRTPLRTITGRQRACSIGMLSVQTEHTRTRRCSKSSWPMEDIEIWCTSLRKTRAMSPTTRMATRTAS